jgi:hypothetical protein
MERRNFIATVGSVRDKSDPAEERRPAQLRHHRQTI